MSRNVLYVLRIDGRNAMLYCTVVHTKIGGAGFGSRFLVWRVRFFLKLGLLLLCCDCALYVLYGVCTEYRVCMYVLCMASWVLFFLFLVLVRTGLGVYFVIWCGLVCLVGWGLVGSCFGCGGGVIDCFVVDAWIVDGDGWMHGRR